MSYINEYINKKMSAKDLEDELLRLIKEYNRIKGSYLIVYSAAISKAIPNISLNMDDYYIIYDLLRDNNGKLLDFYIETPGGSGEAAEEVVRFLRSKFETISFLVSGEAKSAGTLMVLSADEILMTNTGSLGPIDAQVRVGRSVVSAYDYVDWVDKVRKDADQKGSLNPVDATMVAQISPGELMGIDNSLNFAKDLVKDWLPKYKFKNWKETETNKIQVTQKMKEDRAAEIVEHLVNHTRWRSHGRSLKIGDLENLKLKIHHLDDDKDLCEITYRIQTVLKLLFTSTSTYKIIATESNKIFANAVASNGPVPLNQPGGNEVSSANLDITCSKCSKIHKLYVKFENNPQIDKELQAKGYKSFPSDNKLKCDCGLELDLTAFRNEIEVQTHKKIVS